ncbi:hypothetical protein GXP67_31560 [Rhodocytophaga rosea]|uniref:DoxX family protein n=1 Tax=Rhodocytophaga rosea TaxID=2704465 RepID=A0A6C0GST5_9BACT|nr:hypothetical protein [Rhodocytophaga rosea]QHT70864.1 hypothetical protein GXP67_31560 [Rhodocytophaga rosea]
MKKLPIPILVVSILFILAGSIGFTYHVKEFYQPDVQVSQLLWVLFLRILAIVCGSFLLLRMSQARWLAIAWLVYHVYIGALNSTSQMIAHIIVLVIVTILLFLPISTAFFQKKNNQ